jgi:hypothetical protein
VSTILIKASTGQMCSIVSLQKALMKCNYQLVENIPIISRLEKARRMVREAKNLDERVEALQLLVSALQECTNPSLLPKTLKLAGFTLTLQAGAYGFEKEVDKESAEAYRKSELLEQVSKLNIAYKDIQESLEASLIQTQELAGRARSEQERHALIALCQAAREADKVACDHRRKEIIEEIDRLAPKFCEDMTKTELENGTIQYVLIYN